MTEKQRLEHLDYQRRYFDRNCEFFRQPIPEQIEERTRQIVKSAKLGPSSRVLDIGTGMGVLVKHFLEEGVLQENIVGCDLSSQMLAEAKKRYPYVQFWQGDVTEFPVAQFKPFDAAFFNACFGNIFNQEMAVSVTAHTLKSGGRLIISHPLGNEFVEKLRQQDEHLVLTLMPDRSQLQVFCDQSNLTIELLQDSLSFYLAVLRKN